MPGGRRLSMYGLAPPTQRLALLLALGALLLSTPLPQQTRSGAIHARLGPGILGAAAAHADDADGDADGAEPVDFSGCREVCYDGLVETAKASCKAHEYNPGLFKMMTDARTRRRGQSFFGDRSRLLAALHRYWNGGNLTIVVVGGSIAAGQGAVDAPSFPKWLEFLLNAHLPETSRVRVRNGAVPGTSSQYMSACHNVHVPADADIVFVEYAVNDEEMPMPHMNNQVRRPYERLLRKLLKYPNQPAVVLMHAYRWFQIPVEASGQFWNSGERQQIEFGMYYGLPQVSVKACCYHFMAQGKEGYQVKRPRADMHGRIQHENSLDASLKGFAFFYDPIHPDGNTGHRVMGELAFQLIMDVFVQVLSGYQLTDDDRAAINALLPPPMLPGNFETSSDKCFIGPAFVQTLVSTDGFEWVNEGKNPLLPKWGYVGREPGKWIKFKVNTTASTGKSSEVTVELGYLRSYEQMGRAEVQCESGCHCAAWTLDGHQEAHNSQTFLHPFQVTQADECVIAIKVLHETSSGKNKIKLTGIMVSEEPEARSFGNSAAWDWVALASSKDPNGVFEIGNAVRRSLAAAQEASSAQLMERFYASAAAGGLDLAPGAAGFGTGTEAAAGSGSGVAARRGGGAR